MEFWKILLILTSYGIIIATLWYHVGRNSERHKINDIILWNDVNAFLQWWEEDVHDFDIDFNRHKEPIGYVNVRTGKKYTRSELFDYWINNVK